ncbi:MAG: helix-turn-helix domain-containing protein [Sulfitobacter sp.]
MMHKKNVTVGFLLFPQFPMACLTSMIEPLRAANEIIGHEAFGWTLISETGARIEASAKVWFDPDVALAEVDAIDQLFLLSGPASQFAHPAPSQGKLRKMARHGLPIGAISGGVFPLARAGLLEGHTASVHWCYEGAFRTEFPTLKATDDVIAIDRRCATAAGAAAAFDLALRMIEENHGADVATEVACWFQHPLVRGEGVMQRKPSLNRQTTLDMLPPSVRKAVDLFASHIEDPLTISDVAGAVGLSVRQLERSFQKSTGMSPMTYYRTTRMNAARQLVLYSNDTMMQIATAVGYASSGTLIQTYEDVFGIHPAKDREKINMFRTRENTALPNG